MNQCHTPDDNVATLTAVNPVTGNQVTTNLYGTSLETSSIACNDLLVATIYPDSVDSTDCVQFAYNRQSQVQQNQDQNGNVHAIGFDGLARPIGDIVTTLGAGIDGTVMRIDTGYEIRGMIGLVTSYADTAGTSVVNQVTLSHDAFEVLATEKQDLTGSGGPLKTVSYTNADGTSNSIRPTGITYPYATGNRSVLFIYGLGDDKLSRVTSLFFASGSSTSIPVVQYGYFGLASIASTTYPQPSISSTMASGPSYPGFDLFGRVVNLTWVDSSAALLAGLGYGYNQASSRTYRKDMKAATGFDELYSMDGLQRLIATARGTLTTLPSPITSPTLQQSWNLDATGNWSGFSNFDLVTASNSLVQERTSNAANEIIDMLATVGNVWATPGFDRNGNMTTIPQPNAPASTFAARFDAWNRLMTLSAGSTAVQTNAYDGLNRRVIAATQTETRYFIYSNQWQVLEEYVGSATVPDRQYVWGIRYIDDLVLRDRSLSDTLERLYALQDANWNVVAVCDTAGAVQQRYV